ncbi:DUF6493 family protein [Nonomuraea jiangxiensis]|uniref:DUF6493 family protein n=1 Tax=Nonomuraea jiangxiensis TaxID=633440 RepID=UPI000B86174F|nr:DUF6493 family protein [Nonomuraea jiangxiensis]
MNAVQGVLDRIETGSVTSLVTLLHGLTDDDKRAVARHLPTHLNERRRAGFEAERRLWELAALYRLAGAACLSGAEQVASWLNRRELSGVEPKADAIQVMSVLANRPLEWRRDLAVRLVRRLRPAPTGSTWRRVESLRAWDLAAALVIETGVEPPENDAFVSGWVLRTVERQWMSNGTPVLADDRLLDHMLPRLFQAAGVADGLGWDPGLEGRQSIVGELVELARTGRVPRQALLEGCVSRFLAGGDAAETGPFVTLWRELKPEAAEIPVTEFVRVLPSASSPVVQLALEELRRAESAGALDTELFAEAVQALAYRPEKKNMAAAVKWIADAPPARGAAAVAALAPVFDVETPSLRERAVRVAVKLAPHTAELDREAIREAGTRLPTGLRERLAAAFGTVDEAEPDPVAAPALTPTPLPALARPIVSVAELAAELEQPLWPQEPARMERILSGLVELAHEDRDALVEGLQPWWQTNWRHPFEARNYVYGISSFDEDIGFLLSRCALAVVSPANSRELTALLHDDSSRWPNSEPALQRFVQQRFREVISLFERNETVPVLLATPTAPTGHVDAATLVARMERLKVTEPLEYDFLQALLRLPRRIDPELVVRAERLPSEAGRRLAACLRAGGLPDPVVTWELGAFDRPASYHQSLQEAHARLAPPEGVPGPLAELWTLAPKTGYPASSRNTVWWPPIMPSHREALAAHLLECLPSSGPVEAVTALAHNDGPAGIATASTIVIAMNHPTPAQRALAADATLTLAAYGELPAADLGRAVGHMVRGEQVKLNRIIGVLDEVTAAGAHAAVWTALAQAVPLLLPAPGEKPRPGLGELLKVAVRAAELAGARDEIPGLAELAARKGSSLLIHEARRLHEAISA